MAASGKVEPRLQTVLQKPVGDITDGPLSTLNVFFGLLFLLTEWAVCAFTV